MAKRNSDRWSIAFLTAGLALARCGGGSGGSPTAPGTAQVSVTLTDSPFEDAKAVLVTFSDLSIHRSGGDFERVPFPGGAAELTCDLTRLRGAADLLGSTALPAGHFTMIRLTVSSAALYFDNPSTGGPCAVSLAAPAGRSAPVDVPSGEVKLNREFDLGGASTLIALDFDGANSIHETGGGRFLMTPVIGVLSVQ